MADPVLELKQSGRETLMLRFLRDLVLLIVIIGIGIGGMGAWRSHQSSTPAAPAAPAVSASDRLQLCTMADADWTTKRCLHPQTTIDRSMKSIVLVWSMANQATTICVPLSSTALGAAIGDKALDSCFMGNAPFFLGQQVGDNDLSGLYASKGTYDGLPKPGARIDPAALAYSEFSTSPDHTRLGVKNPFDWGAICSTYDTWQNLEPSKAGQYQTEMLTVVLEDFQGNDLARLPLTLKC
jgi:hypothetical protein